MEDLIRIIGCLSVGMGSLKLSMTTSQQYGSSLPNLQNKVARIISDAKNL
jgi:hypothetical protein